LLNFKVEERIKELNSEEKKGRLEKNRKKLI
jgi:hypothetical protein